MNKINLIKRAFVRQSTDDNCGVACLAMILNYTGQIDAAKKMSLMEAPQGGFSLKQLQTIAASAGLSSRCVEMETAFLKSVQTPVILHTVNSFGQNHFEVCCGFDDRWQRGKFLVADPAIQLRCVPEDELGRIWQSKAALYFDALKPGFKSESALLVLLRQRAYPIGLWLAIPFLSVCITFFGVALTWLLQKGISNQYLFQGKIIYLLLAQLLLISLFKNLFSYLRQFILIRINLSTNKMLMEQFVTEVATGSRLYKTAESDVHAGFVNIQKMQNAISAFIAIIISDGCLVVFLLAGALFIFPLAGLINGAYIAILFFWERRVLPDSIYKADNSRLLASASENALARFATGSQDTPPEAKPIGDYKSFYLDNLQVVQKYAVWLSKRLLLQESLGTLVLVSVIALCVSRFASQSFEYNTLVIVVVETYLITVLMQKICTAFQQVAEGADAAIAHQRK